jgi:hypothetical protein
MTNHLTHFDDPRIPPGVRLDRALLAERWEARDGKGPASLVRLSDDGRIAGVAGWFDRFGDAEFVAACIEIVREMFNKDKQ